MKITSKSPFVIKQPEIYISRQSPQNEITHFFPQDFPLEFHIAMQCFIDPKPFIKENKKVPNKFLLFGRPGTGKSYFVELIHKIFQLPLISVKAGDLEDRFYGESSKRITELLNTRDPQGRVQLIFIDEIDAIAQPRNEHSSYASRSLLNSLLVEIQNQTGDPSVCIFVATNDKDSLDEAFLSRFKQNFIEFKDMTDIERTNLVENLLENVVVQDKFKSIKTISESSKGLSRRDIAEAIHTAETWLFTQNGLYSLNCKDILYFINRNTKNGALSFEKKIKRFVISSLPYINFTHGMTGIIISISQITRYALNHYPHHVIQHITKILHKKLIKNI